MTISIARMTNADATFYPTLGPFLCRRDVAAAVGAPLWDDDGKVWAVARDEAGRVLGFAGVTVKGDVATVCSAYVPGDAPEVWAAVLGEVIDAAKGRATTARATVATELPSFRAAGFKKVRDVGRFAVVERAVRA